MHIKNFTTYINEVYKKNRKIVKSNIFMRSKIFFEKVGSRLEQLLKNESYKIFANAIGSYNENSLLHQNEYRNEMDDSLLFIVTSDYHLIFINNKIEINSFYYHLGYKSDLVYVKNSYNGFNNIEYVINYITSDFKDNNISKNKFDEQLNNVNNLLKTVKLINEFIQKPDVKIEIEKIKNS